MCRQKAEPQTEKMQEKLEILENTIGYRFKNRGYLEEALTHSSFSNEHGGLHRTPDNERLEFLGDSVLSVIVSEYLFENYPGSAEGELTRMRAELVCEKALAAYSREISLGSYLILGKGEEKGGARDRNSTLCDAFEAVIAAVYLDAGADSAAKKIISAYVLPLVEKRLEEMLPVWSGCDYKTLLQQTIQSDSKGEKLEYVEISEEGPDHAKTFTVEARIDSNVFGRGVGSSKKAAEQEAARQALVRCGVIKD